MPPSSPTSITDHFPPELAHQIAQLLGVADPADFAWLQSRLRRFAKTYRITLAHNKLVPNASVVRAQMTDAAKHARRLRISLVEVDQIYELGKGYRRANKSAATNETASLGALRGELNAVIVAAEYAAANTDPKSGPKNNDVLRSAIEALMAVFEMITGNRARATGRPEGRNNGRYNSAEAKAIGLFLGYVDPALNEHTIANMIGEVNKARKGAELRIATFDLMAAVQKGIIASPASVKP